MGDGYTVHIITDDMEYREHLRDTFQRPPYRNASFTFGPNGDTSLHEFYNNPDNTVTPEIFKRPTSVRDAMMDFFVLSKVDHVAWTRNSTVIHLAKFLRHRYHQPTTDASEDAPLYSSETIIGKYPEHKATNRFIADLAALSQKAEHLLINPDDYQLPPILSNVLNFLSDYHLKAIYDVMKNHLDDYGDTRYVKGSDMGSVLYANCRVAKLNKEKWVKTANRLQDKNRFHWMKALIRYSLRNFSIRTGESRFVEIDDSKDAMVYLSPMANFVSTLSGGFVEEDGSTAPPSKKARQCY
jgi:hypothetical protein